tara:strand:- start:25786 stop:26742 length:957 start_codon:yes stop_codon:yes gene_type:complete
MKISLIFTSFLLIGTASATDYSKCKEFFTPQEGLSTPFVIDKTGKITPNGNVISYVLDDENKQELFTFKHPSGSMAEKAKAIVKRGVNNEITEITFGYLLTQKDIDRINSNNIQFQAKGNPELVRRLSKNNPYFSTYSHTTTKIEIKNGQCVPSNQVSHNLVEPRVDGRTITSNLFDMKLCKDLEQFIDDNPEAAACFDPKLNKQVSSIFSNYQQRSGSTFAVGGGIGGFNAGFPGVSTGLYGRVDSLINMENQLWGNEEYKKNIRKYSGRSPIISGHMILQDCYISGLGSFIKDPKIWKEGDIDTTKSKQETIVERN